MKVDGLLYKQIVTNGAASLRANYKIVDALNEFRVVEMFGSNGFRKSRSAIRMSSSRPG